ncbi:MAG: hypothetical protein HC914_20550 [Chloroflexaceae bacterium]|nr:hypothetical protein [Chloroflexaceae bacterium]
MRRLPWGALVLFGALLLPWFVFAWAYFSEPLPVTLAAKRQQALLEGSRSFAEGVLRLARDYWAFPMQRIGVGMAGIGMVALLLRYRAWLLLVGWTVLYSVAYIVLGVSSYFWYNAPLVVGWVALASLGVQALADGVRALIGERAGVWVGALVGAALIITLLLPQVLVLNYHRITPDTRLEIYREVGLWLHDNTPPTASVGTIEIGIIGYYARRPMIDFAGLLQPATAQQFGAASSYGDAAAWATFTYQPAYLVFHRQPFPQLLHNERFQEQCYQVHSISHPRYPLPLVIYQCAW